MRDREKNGAFGVIINDLNGVKNKIKADGLGYLENKEKICLLDAPKEKIIRLQLLDVRIYQKDSKVIKVEIQGKEAA